MKPRNVPTRVSTGAYILHSGISKWNGGDEQAEGLHGFASQAFPVLKSVSPRTFLRALAAGEVATGALLLTPVVPTAVAGAALTAFSGGLMGLYARTPGLRKPNSVWPSEQGLAVSKDVWMLGIGLGLLVDGTGRR